MKVAIVYDRVNKWGGAERVLLALHAMFPKAPLFTSVYDKKNASWAKVFKVHTSFLQNIPFIKNHHELFPFLMPFAFTSFSFEKYDLVISVTSEFAKGVTTRGKTKHLCICLTPTRYLWSGYDEYFKNEFLKKIIAPLIFLLRQYDRKIAQNPDVILAISHEVQKRIQKYYQRQSIVIYPPSRRFPKVKKNALFMKDYFLVVSRISRFTQYKRIDLAMNAANHVGASLVIVGNGDSSFLKKYAGPTVYFAGSVSEKKLAEFYAHSKALLFPGKEDFGLAMVEAQSFGKPVIAYKAGGAKEIVINGKTGIFFQTQTVSALSKVLKNFPRRKYNRDACIANAKRFSHKAFEKALTEAIKKTL